MCRRTPLCSCSSYACTSYVFIAPHPTRSHWNNTPPHTPAPPARNPSYLISPLPSCKSFSLLLFHTMTGTTTASRMRPANVPRLALPCPETAEGGTGGGTDTPTFRRQINVALGRSHHQRTPRRDVIFNVKHGNMVEKQRAPLAMESSSFSAETTTLSGGSDGDAGNRAFPNTVNR